MEFDKLLSVAAENQKGQKAVVRRTSISKTPVRQNDKKPKGVESAAVKAFLEKIAREEEEKAAKERDKKAALLKARAEVKEKAKAERAASQKKDTTQSPTTPDTEQDSKIPLEPYKMEDFMTGQRRRVSSFVRPATMSPQKVNPCLIRACDEAPVNRCLVKATDAAKPTDKSADKSTEKSADKRDDHKKHKKHRHHDSSKSNDKHRSKTPHENERSKLKDSSGGTSQTKNNSAKPESKGSNDGDAKKKGALSNKLLASLENARKKRAQALDFQSVLALASEQKNKDPIPAMKVPVKKPEAAPMTQKEKERLERTKTPEYQAWLKRGGSVTQGKVGSVKKPSGKIPEADQHRSEAPCRKRDSEGLLKGGHAQNSGVRGSGSAAPHSDNNHVRSKTVADVWTKPESRPRTISDGHAKLAPHGNVAPKIDGHARANPTGNSRPNQNDHVRLKTNSNTSKNISKPKIATSNDNSKPRPNSVDLTRTKSDTRVTNGHARPHSNQKPTQQAPRKPTCAKSHETVIPCRTGTPSSQGRPQKGGGASDAPMSSCDRLYSQIKKNEPKPVKRKQPLSEDEDSELDDFIDDDDGGGGGALGVGADGDYSSAIRNIFGYDRRKYRYETDDDLRGMETSYGQQMKEERKSGIIGRKEDLEEERREAEMLRKKAAKKKAKSKH